MYLTVLDQLTGVDHMGILVTPCDFFCLHVKYGVLYTSQSQHVTCSPFPPFIGLLKISSVFQEPLLERGTCTFLLHLTCFTVTPTHKKLHK